ncbi:outer membrane protein assembly factor BamA [Geotalea uraniireducens]|uniref:Outer membrane protein assembly factor BamA n=1 Tax=Geotalea uraniireducens (strain Rf4) TaxID=351605 RepID=A5G6I0_GEOUR|nr:surface antigen (D15) [Geotalea uraniireducens Rf4]
MFEVIKRIVFIVTVVALFCCTAFAEEEKIDQVLIKGNRRIETAAILNSIKLKNGDSFFSEKVDDDVRAIFKLGYFQDVKATREKGDKGLVLTYIVVEKPVVREIKIDGNKELSLDKIKEAVEIKSNTIFSPKELTKSIKKIKKLYADDGYYLAEVDGTVEKRSETEVKVLFKITEGKKVLIKTIQFEGNKAFPAKKLKKVMETSEQWMFSWLTSAGTYKEEVLKNDVNLIADLYFNSGYINVKIGEPTVGVLEDKSGLIVIIGITEGEQFRTGALGFKGDLLENAEDLNKKIKMKTGEVFSRGTLRGDVFTLTDLYADKGYAFANITPLSKVNPEQKTIDITFDMEKGEKVYIDRINIGGNTKTRDKVVRRELKLAEGDLYSSTALKRSKQNLMNLGFFEEANLATVKGSADNKLDLNVDVKEKPTGTFSIGAGYSSLDGIIGQGSVQQANFLGLGLKATAAASIGGKTQTYNVGLTDPYFLDSRWTLGTDVYRSEREYLDFTRRVTGADIKAGYPLSDNLSTFWIYKFEKKEIFNESQALLDSIRNGTVTTETSGTTSAISASITRNTTDYRLDPSSGMMNTLSAEFAGIGGSNRYARYISENALFYPVGLGTVFSLRGTFGYIQNVGKDVPIDEKFYLGGINTLRGYSGRTVSPSIVPPPVPAGVTGIATAANRVFIGGDSEVVFNAEYQFPLLKDVGVKGVVFFDAGNAYSGTRDIFTKFQASYGGGIRWFSPIGPLRLEYGIPVNPRDGIDKASGRFEFSIGSFF